MRGNKATPSGPPPLRAPPRRADVDYESRQAARLRTLDYRHAGAAMVAGTRSPRLRGGGRGPPRTAGQANPASGQAQGVRLLPGPHLDDAGALGPLAGAGTAEDEHDQRFHEAVRAEEKRPAGQQREAKAQDVQQPPAAAVQHTQRLRPTLRRADSSPAGGGAGRGGGKGAGRVGARRGPAAVAAEVSAPQPEGAGLPLLPKRLRLGAPRCGPARVLVPAPLPAHSSHRWQFVQPQSLHRTPCVTGLCWRLQRDAGERKPIVCS